MIDPRRRHLRVMAKARPGAMPVPAHTDVHALTRPEVFHRWGDAAAGIRALAPGDAVITMFDQIGEDFWSGGGVTARSVAAQLRAIGDRPVEVRINSPGGDIFEGFAIYNVLREHPQEITVKVMGWACSAASMIAMAGDRIEIGAAGFLMIHNCWVVAAGNRHDLAQTAQGLEPFDRAMADVYAARSGLSSADLAAMMDAETWFSGAQAVERGLADALLPADVVTVDDDARAEDRRINELRAVELTLVSSGMTRRQARACISRIKGTPGAAPAATPGAGGDWSGITGLIATLRS